MTVIFPAGGDGKGFRLLCQSPGFTCAPGLTCGILASISVRILKLYSFSSPLCFAVFKATTSCKHHNKFGLFSRDFVSLPVFLQTLFSWVSDDMEELYFVRKDKLWEKESLLIS
jgi:hypothetical protein